MKKAFQVVFLIDLDGTIVPQETGASDGHSTNRTEHALDSAHTLRHICLRFLTYFAAQQCISNGQSSVPSTLVKWGYKFYHSRSKKMVRQRYQFKDLELESLEQFETDLECQLRNIAGSESVASGSEAAALQQAIREIVCDFPWDSPYISSPVKRPRGNNSSLVDDASSTVDNYTILITRIPSSSEEFQLFLGAFVGSCPTVKHILERIVPTNVRRQMCDVAKIRLLWLDAYPYYPPDMHQDFKRDVSLNTFELFHQTLTTIGGGLIPLGSVLLHDTLRDGFEQKGPGCHRFHFPEAYRLRIPFASIVSLYMNYAEIPNCASFHMKATLDLPSNESNSSAHHEIELLPLFKKISCHRCAVSRSESDTTNIESSECDCDWNPRSLRPLGTMKLADVRKNFSADSKVYICCPRRKSNERKNSTFEDLLDNLTNDYNALVVSCDALRLGFLVPANDDSCVSLVYLMSETSGTKHADTVWKLMDAWEVPVRKGLSGLLRNSNSPFFLKNWLLNCDNVCKTKADRGEEELLSKLQRTRESSGQERHSNSNRNWRLKDEVCVRGSKIMSNSVQYNSTRDDKKWRTSGEQTFGLKPTRERGLREIQKSVKTKDLSSEERLLSDVNTTYNRTVQNEEKIIEGAQEIVLAIKEFHLNVCKDEEVDMRSTAFLTKNVLMDSKNLSSKHAKLKCLSKNTRIQEYHLQTILRLEMQVVFANGTQFTDEVTSMLRSLSFVAGPSVLSSFLHETLVENYYPFLKESVTEICEELNQPLPNDSSDVSSSPTPSLSSLCSFSSDKNDDRTSALTFSQLSPPSSLSSCNSQPKINQIKRREIVRHPSFGDVGHKRQIVVPFIKTQRNSIGGTKKFITRSVEKKLGLASVKHSEAKRIRRNLFDVAALAGKHSRSHSIGGFAATKKHYTPLKRGKLTTPKGHHILRTKRAAETPVHKQVANVALSRQRNKRKSRSKAEDVGEVVVEESPDRQSNELPFRRSPRRHASSLERQASFYSSDSQSRNLAKAESQMQAEMVNESGVSYNGEESAPFFLSESSLSSWSTKTPQHGRGDAMDDATSPIMFATPRSKARVRRNLNLGGGLMSPNGNETKGAREGAGGTLVKKRKLDSLSDEDVAAPRRSQRLKSVEELQTSKNGHTSSNCRKSARSKGSGSDSTPSIDAITNNVGVPAANGVVAVLESSDSTQTEGIVISTPSRNGIDSPTECQPTDSMPLIHGPLAAANLEDYLSRSSSPRIPLLVSEMGIGFDDYMSDYEPLYVDYDDEIWSDCSKNDSPFTSDVVSQEEVDPFEKTDDDEEAGLRAVPSLSANCDTNGLTESRGDNNNVVPSCETALNKQSIIPSDVSGSKSSLDIPNHLEPCNGIADRTDDTETDGKGNANGERLDTAASPPLFKTGSIPKTSSCSNSKDNSNCKLISPLMQSVVHLTTAPVLAPVSDGEQPTMIT